MSRPLRIEYPKATYHVMSHGVDFMPIFTDDCERRYFLGLIQEFVDAGLLVVHAFCLMITHFHLLCETPKGGLSRIMQRLLLKYSIYFNKRHQRQGHLWRARYKAVLVEDGDYFLHCSRYIHLNPMKANICTKPEEYRWSSYRHYLEDDDNLNWVAVSRTLRSFSSRRGYSQFVTEGIQQELKDPFEEAIGGTIFGSRAFADGLRPLVKNPQMAEDVPSIRNLEEIRHPSVEEVCAAVDQVFPHLSQCRRRRMLAYALRRFTQISGRDIAAAVKRCPSMVTHVWQEMQSKLAEDEEFRDRIQDLAQLLGKKID